MSGVGVQRGQDALRATVASPVNSKPALPTPTALAHRLATLHDEVEEAPVGIDDEGAGRLLRRVVDQLADVARLEVARIDRLDREGFVRDGGVPAQDLRGDLRPGFRDGGRSPCEVEQAPSAEASPINVVRRSGRGITSDPAPGPGRPPA